MCNKCNNSQTIPTNLFNAIYDSPFLLEKQPKNVQISRMRGIFMHSRDWFADQVSKHNIHPMIDDLLNHNRAHQQLREHITDWREMLLEWPHVAETDPTKLAYTQSDEKGKRNIQTITSLGKYLKRHMPTCPDHELRDFVTRYTVDPNACKITTDLEKMIHIVQNGPFSCMQKGRWDESDHPYRVYDPKYGWGMAYRMQCDEYWGRCLVNVEAKGYVRSYKRDGSTDEMLEAWLQNEGYQHLYDWDGLKVAKIEHYGDYIMPYIDGNSQQVDDHGTYFMICEDGDYDASNTDGRVYAINSCSCDCCGDSYHEDDMTYVGQDGDRQVCEGCRESNYTYVIGYRGHEYWVHSDDAVYCESDDQHYDRDHLDYNDIIWVDTEDGYYKSEDIWWCEGSSEYYTNDTTSYEIDGELYHEDHLPDGWELDEHGALRQVETA